MPNNLTGHEARRRNGPRVRKEEGGRSHPEVQGDQPGEKKHDLKQLNTQDQTTSTIHCMHLHGFPPATF